MLETAGTGLAAAARNLAQAKPHGLAGVTDRQLFVTTVAAVLAVTSLPYAFAYCSTPADKQFMGVLLNVPDSAQYMSWARESGRSLLIENRLTPEVGNAVYFNLFWFVVGRLSALLGLGLAETVQVVRLFVGPFLLGSIYWFTGLVMEGRLRRWTGFGIVALGGGLGWVFVLAKQFTGQMSFPLDLYVPEPNSFLSIMAFPHQAMAEGLLVVALGLGALAFERGSLRLAHLAGFVGLLLGAQHGYDLLVLYSVLGSVGVVLACRSGIRPMLLLAAMAAWSVPAAAYAVLLTRLDPVWRGVLAQYGNAGVYTPPPPHLLILMGLPLIMVVSGHEKLVDWRKASPRELLLRSWMVVGFALLYLPTDFQIKMLGGWQVPVGILATRLLLSQLQPAFSGARLPVRWRLDVALAVLAVAAVLPANAYLWAWRLVDLGRHDYPYYLYKDEVAALRWLEANSRPSDVVLSSLTIGQYIPAVAGNRAFLAHWAQTLEYFDKVSMVQCFFAAGTQELERRQIIERFNVSYVFHGVAEERLGEFDPGKADYLVPVFSSPHARLYRVMERAATTSP